MFGSAPRGSSASSGQSQHDEESPLLEDVKQPWYDALDCGSTQFVLKLEEQFGKKLLWLLFVVQHLVKGFTDTANGLLQPYLMKNYSVPAPTRQLYSSVIQLPWAMKPIIGIVSDMVPLFGYQKNPYMGFASVVGSGALLAIGLIPQDSLPILGVVSCLFLFSFQASTCDLLSEAKYAERMQEKPAHGPSLLSYVWFGLQTGGLVATLASGPVISLFGPKYPYAVIALPAASVLIVLAAGCLEEPRKTPEEAIATRNYYWQQSEICFLSVLMLGATICLMITTVVSTDPVVNCYVALVVTLAVITGFSLVLSPTIAKFNAFSLLQTAFGASTAGATFYFYTDTREQYPEGPHFSETFYNSVMGTLGAVCSLVGIYTYQQYLSTWKYRSLVIVTSGIICGLGLLDVVMFSRLNVSLGIPDHALVLGLSVFENIVAQWNWMPQVVILSYLCPKGMEATMYALLAGCHNLGNSIASIIGAYLLHRLDCSPSGAPGESAQFQNLWKAALISSALPLVTALFLYRLIPDAKQNTSLVSHEPDSATAGSLWRQFRGY